MRLPNKLEPLDKESKDFRVSSVLLGELLVPNRLFQISDLFFCQYVWERISIKRVKRSTEPPRDEIPMVFPRT